MILSSCAISQTASTFHASRNPASSLQKVAKPLPEIPSPRALALSGENWCGVKSSLGLSLRRVWSQVWESLTGIVRQSAHDLHYPPTCDVAWADVNGTGWGEMTLGCIMNVCSCRFPPPSNVTLAEMIQPVNPAEKRVNANLREIISCVGGGQGGAWKMHD